MAPWWLIPRRFAVDSGSHVHDFRSLNFQHFSLFCACESFPAVWREEDLENNCWKWSDHPPWFHLWDQEYHGILAGKSCEMNQKQTIDYGERYLHLIKTRMGENPRHQSLQNWVYNKVGIFRWRLKISLSDARRLEPIIHSNVTFISTENLILLRLKVRLTIRQVNNGNNNW